MLEDIDFSVENVRPQINDSLVLEIESKFEEMILLIRSYRIKKSSEIRKIKAIDKVLSQIDELIFERFGFKTRHIGTNEETVYGIIPPNVFKNTIHEDDVENNAKKLDKYLAKYKKSEPLDQSRIKNTHENMKEIMFNKANINKKLNNNLFNKGFIVDFEKAKIEGFSEDNVIHLIFDPKTILTNDYITGKHFVSMLLHEIGHVFNMISHLHRGFKGSTVLMDSFTSSFKNSEDFSKSLKIFGKELGVDVGTNDLMNFTAVLNNGVKNAYSSDLDSSRDNERLADQFAVRFGYGKELVEALGSFEMAIMPRFPTRVGTIVYIVNIYLGILVTLLTGALFVNPIAVVGMVIFTAALSGIRVMLMSSFVIFIYGVITGSEDNKKGVHDNYRDRVQRIKKDLVRQLRLGLIDKSEIKSFIETIDDITSKYDELRDDKLIGQTLGDILSFNSSPASFTVMQRKIESLMENDLHVSKNKLQLLLK